MRQIDFAIAIWPLLTVEVKPGAVLEFDDSPNVLVAYRVVVHNGGQIRSNGQLSINCTILEKTT